MFDENNASAVIRLPECQIVMMEPKHMMRFREHDIKKLARTQILTPENDNFEVAAKEYTGFAAKIVRQRMWALIPIVSPKLERIWSDIDYMIEQECGKLMNDHYVMVKR